MHNFCLCSPRTGLATGYVGRVCVLQEGLSDQKIKKGKGTFVRVKKNKLLRITCQNPCNVQAVPSLSDQQK